MSPKMGIFETFFSWVSLIRPPITIVSPLFTTAWVIIAFLLKMGFEPIDGWVSVAAGLIISPTLSLTSGNILMVIYPSSLT